MSYVPTVHTRAETLAWMQEVVFSEQHVVVAEVDGPVVGYASYTERHLSNMYVLPEFQRRGVGSALLSRILEQAPAELELRVFEQNAGAIRFYERSGFATVSRTNGDNEERLPDRLMRRNR